MKVGGAVGAEVRDMEQGRLLDSLANHCENSGCWTK